jgi:hypothetical protein
MFHSSGQRFPKHYLMTLGVEFCMKAIALPEADTSVELHLLDTAGQEIYAEMVPSYWENVTAVVLVYDVTRVHTLEACASWYERILQVRLDPLPRHPCSPGSGEGEVVREVAPCGTSILRNNGRVLRRRRWAKSRCRGC